MKDLKVIEACRADGEDYTQLMYYFKGTYTTTKTYWWFFKKDEVKEFYYFYDYIDKQYIMCYNFYDLFDYEDVVISKGLKLYGEENRADDLQDLCYMQRVK